MRKGIVVFCLAVLLSQVIFTHPSYAQDDSDKCAERFGTWDEETERCIFSGGIDIKIAYPIEYADVPFIDATVSEYYSAVYTQLLDFYSGGGFSSIAFAPWALDISYETYQASENVVSLKFMVYEFTGGAHGNTTFTTLTFNLAEERVLTLDDVFVVGSDPWTVIAPMAEEQIKAALSEFDMDADDTWISEGAGTNPANYDSFVLTEDSILFIFDPYVVAPYAAGPQQVEIPFSAVEEMLNPDLLAPVEE
jgi:hypothetical protein